MLELRIVSGLHRGATLPLDEDTLVVGADEAVDVVLLDPGIEARHATLRKTTEGWALAMLDGDVLGGETNEPLESVDLYPGEFARIGRIWVTVTEQDADWAEPPPEPVDIESDDLASDAAYAEALTDATDRQGDSAQVQAEDAPADGGKPEAQMSNAKKRPMSRPKLLICCVSLLTAFAAWGAYRLVGGADDRQPSKPALMSAANVQKPAAQGKTEIDPAHTDKNGLVSPEELRAAFRKRLAEVDLLKRFDLDLKDNSWSMRATLDDEETVRFERVLAGFVAQYKIVFPIQAKVGGAELMLPFKIRQVVSGTNASIVTADGDRLYIGDEYKGVRLVSIQGSRIVFAGKRRIEMRW